jgi:tRNA threonylcarbamoyladenosine biosynthesis protein TsaB
LPRAFAFGAGMLSGGEGDVFVSERILLIDTCGEGPAVALCEGTVLVCVRELPQKSASAELVSAVRELLAEAGWALGDMAGVGVVNGPGSFTGLRTGLAAAKGFCEAAALPLAAVSRLEVLCKAEDALAALDAGRGQVYVREGATGREWMCGLEGLIEAAAGRRVAVAEEKVLAFLGGRLEEGMVVLRRLQISDALPAVLRNLRAGGEDAALVEANYVRDERDIYPRAAGL